MIFSTSRANYC